ncbi:MAG: response regulator [Gloeotrichia echinulata GP01]
MISLKVAQQAVDLALTQRPDLIVMDIQMPVMNGLEAMRCIRNHQQFHIPIIVLTALAMPGDRQTCLAAGANEYLTKPVKLKQLTATIQQLLER